MTWPKTRRAVHRADGRRRPHLPSRPPDLSRPRNLQAPARPVLREHRRLDRAACEGPTVDARPLPGGNRRSLHLPEAREAVGTERASPREDSGEDEGRGIPGRRQHRSRRLARADGHRRDPHVEFHRRTTSTARTGSSGTSTPARRSRGSRSSRPRKLVRDVLKTLGLDVVGEDHWRAWPACRRADQACARLVGVPGIRPRRQRGDRARPTRSTPRRSPRLDGSHRSPRKDVPPSFPKRKNSGVTMKALCWHGTGDVRVDTVPDPKIEDPRDIVIKITSTAICGSDLHLVRWLSAHHGKGRRPGPREHGRGGRRRQRRLETEGRRPRGRAVHHLLRRVLFLPEGSVLLLRPDQSRMPRWPRP